MFIHKLVLVLSIIHLNSFHDLSCRELPVPTRVTLLNFQLCILNTLVELLLVPHLKPIECLFVMACEEFRTYHWTFIKRLLLALPLKPLKSSLSARSSEGRK